jgi:hypothetical protein
MSIKWGWESMTRYLRIAMCALAVSIAAPVAAQDSGHGGGESGHGDLFGDLVHVKRFTTNDGEQTGRPILEMRWIEYPMGVYGWGFCPIPIDAGGAEIGFAPFSCDAAVPDAVIEVDYFGRLSAGRTKERNMRMHFDEVISTIKDPAVTKVDRDPAGRLRLTFTTTDPATGAVTTSFKVIDSPQENLALYRRVMVYGHIQTDPMEVDTAFNGDPAIGTVYHPALTKADYDKFEGVVEELLLKRGGRECFDAPGYGVQTVSACGAPEEVGSEDFILATGFLGGAADKTGKITVDLVQYMNRILKIASGATEWATARKTVAPIIRFCDQNGVPQIGDDDEPPLSDEGTPLPWPVDPSPLACGLYDPDLDLTFVTTLEAMRTAGTWVTKPAGWVSQPEKEALLAKNIDSEFKKLYERFVDFANVEPYVRATWFSSTVSVIKPLDATTWILANGVSMKSYLDYKNGPLSGDNIAGFVSAASDSVRAVEFVHNYAVPDDLAPGWSWLP